MLALPENLLGSSFMNILIENAETLQYFTSTGQWTKNADEGKSFSKTEAAVEVAKLEPIRQFNIVCYISKTKQFINMDHGQGTVAETTTA